MTRALALLLLLASACSNPPFELRFELTSGISQQCYSSVGGLVTTDCADISMACPAVLSVRIVPPNDPTVPYISLCEPLTGAQDKLCSIARVNLPEPTVPVPEQVLEVQMAVFPASAVSKDPVTNALICPKVEYGADNLPIPVEQTCDEGMTSCPVVPAVGGRTYYYPGDDKTVVQLGCTDLAKLESSCTTANPITTTATVIDFDTVVSVSAALAQRLSVTVGEPMPLGDAYQLNIADERDLPLLTGSSPPAWKADVDLQLQSAVCIKNVDESVAQSTASLTCKAAVSGATRVDVTAVRLSKATLDKILAALGKTSFPDQGLVIGRVLDNNSAPLAGVSVVPSGSATIQYLSPDLSTLSAGTMTTTSGVFVSQDAAFGSTFQGETSSPLVADPVFGGLVDGKVTIVVIRFNQPSTGG